MFKRFYTKKEQAKNTDIMGYETSKKEVTQREILLLYDAVASLVNELQNLNRILLILGAAFLLIRIILRKG